MAHLSIELPEDLSEQVRSRAVEAGHPSVAAYVQSLLRDDIQLGNAGTPAAQKFHDATELAAMLQVGLDSGPAVEVTDADWERKRQGLIKRHSERDRS